MSNVYSAYLNSDIDATRQAVYDKLKNIETKTAREIVRYMADESELIIREMNGAQPPLLSGLKTKFLDGNCIEATEHRLKPLRETKAGALPGKSLVVFEPESRTTRIAGGLRKAPKRGCYFSCRNLAILAYPTLPDFAHRREPSPHPSQPCSHSILATKSAFL